MSGPSLALSSLCGRRRHTAQTPLFALFVCAVCVPASCRLRFVLCRSPAFPRFPSCAHTWLRPHVTVWALLVFARVVEEQACCGRVCLRVAEFRVYARGVFVWVFACFGVCASGVVGQCGPAAPCPAFFGWCSRSGVGLLACAVVLRARWAEGGLVGAGHGCPAPYSVALPPLRCAWMRKRVGVPARSGENTHTEGGRRAGWKLACSLAWCVQPTGGVKGEVGIGPCRAGLASVRAIVGLGGDWVARLPSWWWGWVGGNDFLR